MRHKKTVACDYCGNEELEVYTNSEPPFFCNNQCQQMREQTDSVEGLSTLSIDRKYVDIEDSVEWQNLPNTLAKTAKERQEEERALALTQARKRNERNLNRRNRASLSSNSLVYRFDGEIHTSIVVTPDDYKLRRQVSAAYKRQIYRSLQTYLSG
tara:strand:+ start:57 stop:521 length:465 start_codon:yes stop_codon:yes gene_type:complete